MSGCRMLLSILFSLFLFTRLCAQEDLSYYSSAWDWSSRITGTVSHVTFSNWAGEGVDYSYVAGLKMNIDPSWSSGVWSFAGSFDGKLSTFGGNGLPPRKTEDRLELNVKAGRQFWKTEWLGVSVHGVIFADLLTQFLMEHDFTEDPDGKTYTRNFMAPGFLTDGIGADFRSDTLGLSIVITPLASKQTIALDQGVDRTMFGLDSTQKMSSSPGAYAHVTVKKNVYTRTTFTLKAIFFADYTRRSLVDMSLFTELDYHITGYLKFYVSLQAIMDDDMKVRLYEDLDGDGSDDDFAGIGQKLQLYGQFGIGIDINF